LACSIRLTISNKEGVSKFSSLVKAANGFSCTLSLKDLDKSNTRTASEPMSGLSELEADAARPISTITPNIEKTIRASKLAKNILKKLFIVIG
jgi:hypothetical protein